MGQTVAESVVPAEETTGAVIAEREDLLPARSAVPRARGTVRLLTVVRALVVVALVALGATSAFLLLGTSDGVDRAREAHEQHARIQRAQQLMSAAHAEAAQGLLGKQGAAENFTTSVVGASQELTASSAHSEVDAESIAAAQEGLIRYVSAVAGTQGSGSASDAQIVQFGQAGAALQSDVLARLATLSAALEDRVDAATQPTSVCWWLVVPAGIAGAIVLWASVIIARRSHRVLNPGLILATVLAGLAVAATAFVFQTTTADVVATARQELTTIENVATARTSVAQARAAEGLLLVRASGLSGADQKQWQQLMAAADERIAAITDRGTSGRLQADLTNYRSAHEKVLTTKDRATAVAMVIDGSASLTYSDFDATAEGIITERAARADSALSDQSGTPLIAAIAVAALCLAAAAAAWSGIAARLREYR